MDIERVRRILSILTESLRVAESIVAMGFEEFASDIRNRYILRLALVEVVEAATSLGLHILREDLGVRTVESYAQVFRKLVEHRVINIPVPMYDNVSQPGETFHSTTRTGMLMTPGYIGRLRKVDLMLLGNLSKRLRAMSLELEEAERFRYYELSSEKKHEVLSRLRSKLESHEDVVLAVLYGSFLRDGVFRDIDVAVYLSYREGEELDSFKAELDLGAALSEHVGYPVDVKVLNRAPPWFIRIVLERGIVLIERVPSLVKKLYLRALDEEYGLRYTRI
ncbi:MAG: hypothetical protein DRO39_04140 [Thermoprotei archaeon]|nr:MAG: hypothetical protein DRO39_04140 [Thermoprotei archaeon]